MLGSCNVNSFEQHSEHLFCNVLLVRLVRCSVQLLYTVFLYHVPVFRCSFTLSSCKVLVTCLLQLCIYSIFGSSNLVLTSNNFRNFSVVDTFVTRMFSAYMSLYIRCCVVASAV